LSSVPTLHRAPQSEGYVSVVTRAKGMFTICWKLWLALL